MSQRTFAVGMACGVAALLLALPPASTQEKPPKSNAAEEKPLAIPGGEVRVRGKLEDQFDRTPSTWKVTLVIENPTDNELELGESVVVVEKGREGDEYAANYLGREREGARHLTSIESRYGIKGGYVVDAKGYYKYCSSGASFQLGRGGKVCRIGFSFSSVSGSTEPYVGLGFGRVSPKTERTIEVTVLR
ncbi:MAG: hypothetical protein ACRD3I_08270, partial [Terriglobales bacterium]